MKLLSVGEVMTKEIVTCPVTCTIEKVSQLMTEKNTRTVIIENKIGNPVGLVTGGDIVKTVAKKLSPKTKVGEIVSKELITIDVDEDILDAANLLNKKNIKRLAVSDQGKLVGILAVNDVLKYSPKYLQEFSTTLEKLDTIIKKL